MTLETITSSLLRTAQSISAQHLSQRGTLTTTTGIWDQFIECVAIHSGIPTTAQSSLLARMIGQFACGTRRTVYASSFVTRSVIFSNKLTTSAGHPTPLPSLPQWPTMVESKFGISRETHLVPSLTIGTRLQKASRSTRPKLWSSSQRHLQLSWLVLSMAVFASTEPTGWSMVQSLMKIKCIALCLQSPRKTSHPLTRKRKKRMLPLPSEQY